MIVSDYKEVYFHEFCKKCKHKKLKETEEPCSECIAEATNLHSHRPVKYEEKESKR